MTNNSILFDSTFALSNIKNSTNGKDSISYRGLGGNWQGNGDIPWHKMVTRCMVGRVE